MGNKSRQYFYYALFALVGLAFLAQLFSIQVLDDRYKSLSKDNFLKKVIQFPPRGLIYDRYGNLMVYNDATYDLMVVPRQVKNLDTLEFCRLLKITVDDFNEKMEKCKENPYRSSVFEKQISARTYAGFQEHLFEFQGFFMEVRTDRRYKTSSAGHVLGSIGEVNTKIIENSNNYYRQGEYIGISGIERSYEELLRGTKGVKNVIVDVRNRTVGPYFEGAYDTQSVAGQSIYVTLDAALQAYGEALMNGKIGSVVAIEPATGEILALISTPDYDPNLLIGRERGKNFGKLMMDPLKPMFNRPLSAPYPPGSIFKAISSLIGQQEGVLTPETRYHCGGGYRVGSHTVKCSHGHPSPLDLRGALMHSCNPYFCYVFRSIVDQRKFSTFEESYTSWQKHLESFGIGVKLGIDLYGEAKGILKPADYFNRLYGKGSWKGSNIISMAIGQGELGVTPLQMANVMAIIANRGYYVTPHVLKYVDTIGKTGPKFEKHYTTVDSRFFPIVVEGMADVVRSGTARVAQIDSIEVCGKTGTSQNPHGKDHSIFFAFAPKDNPKIAIAVVVENSGFGSQWAAPIASLMIERYLFPEREQRRKYLEDRMLNTNLIDTVKQNEPLPH
ncbi:MAG TPA: penicillin-binding protein 2 [Bacteroidetes bacterium]|nr:penicillin-binding protein 2 [Bacteroidota bacterium]